MTSDNLAQVSTALQGWSVEPPADAVDCAGITKRLNWLIAQVQGIDAQLTERRKPSDAVWRARAINAKNYRLAELRQRRLERSQLVNHSPQMRDLLERMLGVLSSFGDDINDDEQRLYEEIQECLA